MSFKIIFIIVISVLVTIVLMNNTDEIDFWIFGDARIPKLTILGSMFGLGIIAGFLAGRSIKKTKGDSFEHSDIQLKNRKDNEEESKLSDDDREYIR